MNLLETKQIRLRAPEPNDVDILYIWENDMSLWSISNTLTPFSKFLLTKYIENAHFDIYQTKELRLIIENQTIEGVFSPVGIIDIFDFDPFHNRAGIGIMIYDKINRKKNIATEALQIFINYAFNTLQIHQLYCSITADNEASLNLFKKCGFRITGIKQQWIKTKSNFVDEYFLQLINAD